ncbi:MAG: hypothetical protein R3C53_01310 [Pirellulaceae bacterium]
MIKFSKDVDMTDWGDGWFREMSEADIGPCLQILAERDEDDAAAAEATFARDLLGYFVVGRGNRVYGVSGATPIDGTNASYVLGWTAVARDRSTEDVRKLIQEVVDRLQAAGGRKIFAQVSDYIDPDDGDIYAPMRRSLTEIGFAQEVRHRDYYDRQESQVIYSLRLRSPQPIDVIPDRRGIRLTDIDEIAETDDAYWLSWELSEEADVLTREDFERVFDTVRQVSARCIFMAFPSGISAVSNLMQIAGFRFDGRLLDLYDDGVDELRFRYDF